MSIIIVGRGPSLKGKQLGKQIDSFDNVIRLTNAIFDDDYGYKTDYVLVTTLQISLLRGLDYSNLKEIWLYWTQIPLHSKSDLNQIFETIKIVTKYNGEIQLINKKLTKWLNWYKANADPVNLKCPNVTYPSKGTAAVLAAMRLLKPKELFIAGFDNVMGEEKLRQCHDFLAENLVVKRAAKELKCQICQL